MILEGEEADPLCLAPAGGGGPLPWRAGVQGQGQRLGEQPALCFWMISLWPQEPLDPRVGTSNDSESLRQPL